MATATTSSEARRSGTALIRVTVLGLRGIPNVQGGIETHAEKLYPRLAKHGCDVEVIVRSPYVNSRHRHVGKIRLRRIWSPTQPGIEALVHTLLGVIYAGFSRPDILHLHGVGPALLTPLARLLGLKVVVTHHGPDYDRDKWGRLARAILRLGERFGMRFSNARIAISNVISQLISSNHGVDAFLIPNGVEVEELREETSYISEHSLEPGKYFLLVSRIVPEKRQLDLIRAFSASKPEDWKLAIVGGLGTDSYSSRIRKAAEATQGVVLTGFLNGEPLKQIYSHAGAFVLPSSHEGLPIALLEALSYGLPVMASDIPAHLELSLGESSYFPVGDTAALAGRLAQARTTPETPAIRNARRQWVLQNYDWDDIALQTLGVYKRLLQNA